MPTSMFFTSRVERKSAWVRDACLVLKVWSLWTPVWRACLGALLLEMSFVPLCGNNIDGQDWEEGGKHLSSCNSDQPLLSCLFMSIFHFPTDVPLLNVGLPISVFHLFYLYHKQQYSLLPFHFPSPTKGMI
jgi:hypothetical protein